MDINFSGIIIALCTFLIIGAFHPIVVKVEYHYGTRPWWLFLIMGLAALGGALFVGNVFLSSILGVLGASSLWSIGEIFQQRERVRKGWFPKNPKRTCEYEN